MSTQTKQPEMTDEMMGTKPLKEHEWLNKLVGEWKTEAEMVMGPDKPKATSQGTESVKNLGGLIALGHGKAKMPNGDPFEMYSALGYDVTFKEYRSCNIMSVSSHIWNYRGKLSSDGKTMTLDCVGPSMTSDGTANYRDVIEIQDANHRTLTSYWEGENGKYEEMMKVRYTRA